MEKSTTTSGSRKPKRSSANSILLLILIAGLLLGNIWRESRGLNGLVECRLPSAAGNNHTVTANSYAVDEMERLRRLAKYFQTYRYIPPAPRYEALDPIPSKACGSGPDFEPWWKLDTKQRSRLNEDRKIYEIFFKDDFPDHKGTYLELGAYNGMDESNSRFFDVCLGWKGLLIEGNPVVYPRTIESRPYAHKMSLAPSCSAEYEAVNKTIPFFKQKWTNGGLVGHAKAYTTNKTSIVHVPCAPLSPILQDVFANDNDDDDDETNHTTRSLPTLDFFSLDVEGSEALVLSTIDFRAVQINIFLIEVFNAFCKDNNCEVRRRVRAKLQAEGYKRYEGLVIQSDVYVHPSSPFQVPLWATKSKNPVG